MRQCPECGCRLELRLQNAATVEKDFSMPFVHLSAYACTGCQCWYLLSPAKSDRAVQKYVDTKERKFTQFVNVYHGSDEVADDVSSGPQSVADTKDQKDQDKTRVRRGNRTRP